MRVLIVSWFFPPANTMGALRVGKFAEFLSRHGHEVRVVASRFQPPSPALDVAPDCRVVRTAWLDVNAPAKWAASVLRRRRPELSGAGAAAAQAGGLESVRDGGGVRQRLAAFYENWVNFPDKQVGWWPPAVRAGRAELGDFDPDVVFASAPPFTAAVVGAALARRVDRPLVVEMRDRWSDDPYRGVRGVRGRLERWLEARVMRRACGIVTVSEPWAERYAAVYARPCITVYNGYDADDIARARALPAAPAPADELVIRHVGRIYPGRRDPSPLFQALGKLPEGVRKRIRVDFVGTADGVEALAANYGVRANVVTTPAVAYTEALRRQMDADIVLLLQWNDPAERGNVPGKLFEYLATLRPILGHGDPDGVPAAIIAAREAGLYSNDPDKIMSFLQAKLDEKRRAGRVADNPVSVCAGFDRDAAFGRLERFLGERRGPVPPTRSEYGGEGGRTA